MTVPIEEINFRKRINKINTLRSVLRKKKALYAKLVNVPEAADECIQLGSEISELETQINNLTNLQ